MNRGVGSGKQDSGSIRNTGPEGKMAELGAMDRYVPPQGFRRDGKPVFRIFLTSHVERKRRTFGISSGKRVFRLIFRVEIEIDS